MSNNSEHWEQTYLIFIFKEAYCCEEAATTKEILSSSLNEDQETYLDKTTVYLRIQHNVQKSL